MKVRAAARADAARLGALEEEIFGRRRWGGEALALGLDRDDAVFLVAADARDEPRALALGRLLPAAAPQETESEILTIGVAASARRRGLGAALLGALMTALAQRGARFAFLEVDAANAGALALYARAGFAVVGERPRYYADGADALIMRAALATGCLRDVSP